jgi:hypothetical protein
MLIHGKWKSRQYNITAGNLHTDSHVLPYQTKYQAAEHVVQMASLDQKQISECHKYPQ